jgi:hypothetical protein
MPYEFENWGTTALVLLVGNISELSVLGRTLLRNTRHLRMLMTCIHAYSIDQDIIK